jgi:hypothetical protein
MSTAIKTPRATGRSTRLIDFYIQQLFTTGKIKVEDHYGLNNYGHESTFERTLRRLQSEHRWAYDNATIDKRKLTISIPDEAVSRHELITETFTVTGYPKEITEVKNIIRDFFSKL